MQARLQSGRLDLQFSGPKTRTLGSGKKYAGPKSLRNAKIPKACESI